MFFLIRGAIAVILFAVSYITYIRISIFSGKRNVIIKHMGTRHAFVNIALICVICYWILRFLPFERSFLTFSTPENAFRYSSSAYLNKMVKMIETDKGDWAVFINDDSNILVKPINKKGERWKYPWYPVWNSQFLMEEDVDTSEDVTVICYSNNENNQKMIFIESPIASDLQKEDCQDNIDSQIQIIEESILDKRCAYTIIDADLKDYVITINGENYVCMNFREEVREV